MTEVLAGILILSGLLFFIANSDDLRIGFACLVLDVLELRVLHEKPTSGHNKLGHWVLLFRPRGGSLTG